MAVHYPILTSTVMIDLKGNSVVLNEYRNHRCIK